MKFPSPYLNNQQTDLWVRRSQGLRLDTTHVQAGYGEAFVRELEGFHAAVTGRAGAKHGRTGDARRTPAVGRGPPRDWSGQMSDHLHSAQRARALDQLSSARGVIAGAAIDHRDSLQAVLAKRGLELDHAGITRLKVRVASALAPAATMVLLDAEYAAAQALAAGAVPGSTGLAVPLEGMGYGDVAKLDVTHVPGRLVAGRRGAAWALRERSCSCPTAPTWPTRPNARKSRRRRRWRAAGRPVSP